MRSGGYGSPENPSSAAAAPLRRLEDALGVPVIDPTQAAVAMAIGTVQAGR